MTLGHHEMEAEVKDDPKRRKWTAEKVVSGASEDAMGAFKETKTGARAAEAMAPAKQSWWRKLLRK